MPGGNVGMVNLGDILGKSMGGKKGKKKKMTVKESHDILSCTRVRQNDRGR